MKNGVIPQLKLTDVFGLKFVKEKEDFFMDILMLLQQIFEVCIVPLLGILTAFLVQYINAKKVEISTNVDNKLADKYINMLADTITKCVIATNQTYVDSLKNKEVFTVEAQKEAYQKTMDAVMAILSDEAKTY